MLQVLRDGRFARLWAGQTISFMGDWINTTAVMSLLAFQWQVSALTLSLFGLSMAVPWLFLGPVAGVFADRWNRKTGMIVFDVVRAAAVLGYLAATEVWQVYVVALVMSVAGVFFAPSRTSIIRQIVPKDDLISANSLSSIGLQGTKIIGPAIGGVIVAAAGEAVCFWADSVSFVLSALIIFTVALPDHRRATAAEVTEATEATGDEPAKPASPEKKSSFTAEFKAGLAHIAGSRIILYVTALLGMCTFCIGLFDAVAGVVIREIFGTDPTTMGLVIGAVGLGTALSTLWVGSKGRAFTRQGLCVIGTVWVGVCLAMILVIGRFGGQLAVPGAVALATLVGVGVSLIHIPGPTIIQEETPPEKMGRVGGAIDSLMAGIQVLTYPLGGLLATAFGATNSTFTGGVLLVIAGLWAAAKMPGAWPLRLRPASDAAAVASTDLVGQ